MARFLKAVDAPGQGQGSFEFLPQVKTFGPNNSPATLSIDINAWLHSRVAVPNIHFHIIDVKYQATQEANNVVIHTALIHYLEIRSV